LDLLTDAIISDLEISDNDRYVSVMGLWHAHGQSLYWATRRAGCETHFLPVSQIRTMTQFQPTFVSAIPDILWLIGKLPLTHLRFLRSGSAPLSVSYYQDLSHKFRVPVIEYFGMTEGMSHLLSNPLHGQQRPGTVGVPTKNVNAKIKEGRLYIQSQHAYTDQWFDTGDLAEQDSTGYFRILGRNIDQINVKGYKINPVSVENQLRHRFPQIKDCVVFGKTKLSCLYSGDVDIGVVKQALIQIHPLCQPKHIQNVTIIPIPQTGKISRTWLIEKFQVD
jgi:acyl-coenzyme A synthetase/AMP-(fatty) acid ligase